VSNIEEVQRYIDKLEQQLQDKTDDYYFLFNHPMFRFWRGVRQVRSNPKTAMRDMGMSLRHVIKGRKKIRNKAPKRKIQISSQSISVPPSHPWLFLKVDSTPDLYLVIGEPVEHLTRPQVQVTPDNYQHVLRKYSYACLLINVGKGTSGTAWDGLFSLSNMRMNKHFARARDIAREGNHKIALLTSNDGSPDMIPAVFKAGIDLRLTMDQL
jgi:hypothetical protein